MHKHLLGERAWATTGPVLRRLVKFRYRCFSFGRETTGGALNAQVRAEPTGRLARKRRLTRARLLEAAYHVMSECGVDAAKIKDITDRADLGFGTFYNYFESKDQLASQVLDCLIHDFGRRNISATRGLGRKDPSLIMPVSIRLVLREVMGLTLWQWWAMRPDLLVDRMREGFGPFGMRDMREAARKGIFQIEEANISNVWGLAVWVMVAGIHDVAIGRQSAQYEAFVAETVMRMMGVSPVDARRIANTRLPTYPPPSIDWDFRLEPVETALS